MKDRSARPLPWQVLASELIGTAVLILVGLSLVILMFGAGSPIIRVIPSDAARRLLTGFLFGSTGALIALSPVGKESGAHLNPVVTLGFWLGGKLDARTAVGYILAQLAGGCVGALPLLAWGAMGRSVAFGATLPGKDLAIGVVLLGEVCTTFGLIAGLCIFLGFRKLRPFTPALFPFLYAFMVWAEAPISGTSTNPRTESRSCADLRGMAGMVDLLGRPADRHPRGSRRLQLSRKTDLGRKALLLRERPSSRFLQGCWNALSRGHEVSNQPPQLTGGRTTRWSATGGSRLFQPSDRAVWYRRCRRSSGRH